MINLELYRIFYFTANTGSLTKAAEQLYLTQPGVSHAIRNLEDKLGLKLFHRTARGVILTKEGEALYNYVHQAYNLIISAEKKMDQFIHLSKGEVRVGASVSIIKYLLLPYLDFFNEKYPDIKMNLTSNSTLGNIRKLKEGSIDFCIVRLPLEDKQLVTKEILTVQDCFVAGPKFKHVAVEEISIQELVQYPLIVFPQPMTSRHFLDSFVQSHGVAVAPHLEMGSLQLLIDFAKIGLGISFVTKEFVANDLAEQSLYEVKLKEKIPAIQLGIVYLKDVPISLAAAEFIRVVEEKEKP
jgi:DNA-binding transcriptional LysR family regulator